MANPRKFSEKIALHTQKQAEETAAFEAIMREMTSIPKAAAPHQHLNISQPNLSATFRGGGSLPNVNQMANASASNSAIDLQSALHSLEGMKQGRQILSERLHKDRGRQVNNSHRRTAQLEKRADSSPYGSTAYLSPPPDSSWRRTHSDSSLHTSTMAGQQLSNANSPLAHRRLVEVMAGGDTLTVDPNQMWDKHSQPRPKSCDVPGINIYPSPEQDSGVHMPISNNTGSLPDLTNLHFPSPMTTPIDSDDLLNQQQQYQQALRLGQLQPNNTTQQANSPGQRRRQAQTSPSPLVLSPQQSAQQTSPGHIHNIVPQPQVSTNRQNGSRAFVSRPETSPSRLHAQQFRPYSYPHHNPSGGGGKSRVVTPPPKHSPNRQSPLGRNTSPSHSAPHNNSNSQNQRPNSRPASHPMATSDQRLQMGFNEGRPPGGSMTQYRNSVDGPCPQSPTSPLSQTSYSPSQSPSLSPNPLKNSTFTDAYIQQQRTNHIQHQLEQFNMSSSPSDQCILNSDSYAPIDDYMRKLQDNQIVTTNSNVYSLPENQTLLKNGVYTLPTGVSVLQQGNAQNTAVVSPGGVSCVGGVNCPQGVVPQTSVAGACVGAGAVTDIGAVVSLGGGAVSLTNNLQFSQAAMAGLSSSQELLAKQYYAYVTSPGQNNQTYPSAAGQVQAGGQQSTQDQHTQQAAQVAQARQQAGQQPQGQPLSPLQQPPAHIASSPQHSPIGTNMQQQVTQNSALSLDNGLSYTGNITTMTSPQQTEQTTQNNNIPDIIFTGAEDLCKDLSSAMNAMAMPDSFDPELFPIDEALRVDDLAPLDFDGVQMLTDPNIVTDPAVEDSFRLDRL